MVDARMVIVGVVAAGLGLGLMVMLTPDTGSDLDGSEPLARALPEPAPEAPAEAVEPDRSQELLDQALAGRSLMEKPPERVFKTARGSAMPVFEGNLERPGMQGDPLPADVLGAETLFKHLFRDEVEGCMEREGPEPQSDDESVMLLLTVSRPPEGTEGPSRISGIEAPRGDDQGRYRAFLGCLAGVVSDAAFEAPAHDAPTAVISWAVDNTK